MILLTLLTDVWVPALVSAADKAPAPEDVKAVGADVLRHRVSLTYEAEAEEITSEDIVRRLFEHVEVP